MKTVSVALRGELLKSSARLATCIRIVRRDGNVYGFTTNTKPLIIGGTEYLPLASFIVSDLAGANNMDTDNQTAEAFLSIAGLTEDDLRAGRWDYASYRRFQVNWAGLAAGDKKDSAGHLGEVTVNRLTFIGDLLGLLESYTTSIGSLTQPLCRNNYGDTKCGIPLAGSPTRTVSGTVTFDAGDFFTVADTARTEPDAWFDEGTITFQFASGPLPYEVKSYLLADPITGDPTWSTKTPIAYDTTGIAYTMTKGCRRRFIEDCVGENNNGRRFNGEPWLRGNDAMIQMGRHG